MQDTLPTPLTPLTPYPLLQRDPKKGGIDSRKNDFCPIFLCHILNPCPTGHRENHFIVPHKRSNQIDIFMIALTLQGLLFNLDLLTLLGSGEPQF
jgi:hypothetical protein